MAAATPAHPTLSGAINEDAIIKNRLLVDTRPIKKVIRRYQTYKSTLATGDLEKSAVALSQFLVDLEAFDLGLQKHQLMHNMNQRELDNYQSEKTRIENEVVMAQQNINELKAELESEQGIRENKIEYDALAKKVLEYPSREQSATKIQKEIEKLEKEIRDSEADMEYRKKLLHSVISSMYAMKDAISDDQKLQQEEPVGASEWDLAVGAQDTVAEEEEEGAMGEEKDMMDIS
ncbi:THO complex subunit 7 [Chytridiales sp. JEL 0842]|nr:THO complex subunit 7 [Chytridiales sp. JEL 0842]